MKRKPPSFPEFRGLDPEVYMLAAQDAVTLGSAGCCNLIRDRGFDSVVGPFHVGPFVHVFSPQGRPAGLNYPAWFMGYEFDERRKSWVKLPEEQVVERRILALLLCAEFAREANPKK